MAAPSTTIWDLEPHTRAKHAILGRYLRAWTPILSQGGFPEIVYIDGFAGPGRYSKGEDGSPVIALKAALGQTVPITATLQYLFVEKDPKRAECLDEVVRAKPHPTNFRVTVRGGVTFEDAYGDFLKTDIFESRRTTPAFAFIDPFGWSGVPFGIVADILSRVSCEVLVTFMYEEMNRFLAHSDQGENFDLYFGTRAWRDVLTLSDPRERNRALHDLYLRQLREVARAKYVRSFEMRNMRDVTDYYLFFATNNLLGLKRMKESMWKVDEAGEFTFCDATNPNQLTLFAQAPDFALLEQSILRRFAGSTATVEEVEQFVLADTPFRETHYKKQVLRQLELSKPPRITVLSSGTRRAGTFAASRARIRFEDLP